MEHESLFSLVALMAEQLHLQGVLPVRQAAWYEKPVPTFSDALAAVRREICRHEGFSMAGGGGETSKFPHTLLERLTHELAYAA